MRGLIIRNPHLEKILRDDKIWEIRGRRTKVRGRIALILGGSGTIVGEADLVDCLGPISLARLRREAGKAGGRAQDFPQLLYEETYAWVLANVRRYRRPKPYRHPRGAVIWVTLPSVQSKA